MAARIHCRVVIDSKTHYGHDDPVTGHVELTCYPGAKAQAATELFGPLRIGIDFSGRSKSKIWVNTGQSTQIYRGRAPLFHIRKIIFDEPFRGAFGTPHAFPFAIVFPTEVELGQGIFEHNSGRSAFVSEPRHPLPPSMNVITHGLGHHFQCFVAYVIQPAIVMPGIEIKVDSIPETSVNYSPAGIFTEPTYSTGANQTCSVQNKHLLPESERPKGFKQNTKAIFSSDFYPRFEFTAVVSIPRHLQVGQQPIVSVQIQHRPETSNVANIPPVELRQVSVKLCAYTYVRAERTFFNERSNSGSDTVYMSGVMLKNARFRAEDDWTLTVENKALPALEPSFSTYNIARSYELSVEFRLWCADKDFKLVKSLYVPVLPLAAPMTDAAGNLRVAAPAYEEVEQLPSYGGAPDTHLLASSPLDATPHPTEASSSAGMARSLAAMVDGEKASGQASS